MASELETCLAESGTLAFRVAFKVLRSREDAEDVSQEAIVRALERFESLNDRNRFRAWLVRVAFRLAIDRRRSDWRRAGRETRLVTNGVTDADAERELIAREQAARLRAAVDELPAKLRTPLVLGHIEERSLDEVATLLQVPAGTVKSRSFHARRRLKQRLVKAGVAIAAIGCGAVTLWRFQVGDVAEFPAVSRPASVTASASPRAVPTSAPARRVREVRENPQDAPLAQQHAPTAREIRVLSVPTVDVPVVPVPIVKVPVLQVPVVEVPTATITTVPSGLMEKQR